MQRPFTLIWMGTEIRKAGEVGGRGGGQTRDLTMMQEACTAEVGTACSQDLSLDRSHAGCTGAARDLYRRYGSNV